MIYLYHIYLCLIAGPLLFVFTFLTALITIIGSICGLGKWAGYYPPMFWGKLFCWLAFIRVQVDGRENISKRQSYVFVANHQGAYDIFSVYGFLHHNFRWMMRSTLGRIPLVGWACKCAKMVFVSNATPSATLHTMEAANNLLKQGMSILAFPEGTRTFDGQLRTFRRGAYMLAAKYQIPVVPITINGSFKVLPRQKVLPQPGRITLIIHHTITSDDINVLIEKSRQEIESDLLPA